MTQIENERQRISLNGKWLFKIDINGLDQLRQVQEAFHMAQQVSSPVGLPEEVSDRMVAKDEAGVKDRPRPAKGGNGNGHDKANKHELNRESVSTNELDGEAPDPGQCQPASPVVVVSVPAPWQSQSSELCYAGGVGWYQRSFSIPPEWLQGVPGESQIILGINASDYRTEAWLNGEKVGENEGGYLPFEFDVSHAIQPGENVLTIRVDDSAELFSEVPHGKQGWYGQLSGLWQPVWLERRAAPSISQILVNPDRVTGRVRFEVKLSQPALPGMGLQLRVEEPGGSPLSSTLTTIETGVRTLNLDLQVVDAQAWSPDEPNLYHLEVRLLKGSGEVDVLSKTFGFRKIEARQGRLYLNGELLYLRGVLDQDYYPDTIYTTPTVEMLEDQFRKAKELGINLIRLHIKVPDPVYYDVADRMGMLIWTELPNWTVFSRSAGQRGREMFEGILKRDGHHPSIIIWTIINEDWGTDLVHEPSHRKWLVETYRWLKELDPTRLVVDNSPCTPNFHLQSDLDDYHFYRGLPDQRREWDEFIHQFASRPDFTYGPPEEINRTGEEPLILSEFGNWGLPDADLLVDAQGMDPWWFESGREWTAGVVQPQGVRGRFQRLGLGSVFGSWKSFILATQDQQFNAMKYELESIRRHPDISGYVITELTDVHWGTNGLLDMHRNPKSYHAKLASINADTVIVPTWDRVAYWSGETVHLRLFVAHGAGKDLEAGELHWRVKGHLWGSIDLPALAPGKVWEMGCLSFPAPVVEHPETQRLLFELFNREGRLIASNDLDLAIHPRLEIYGCKSITREIPIFTTEDGLSRKLSELGYTVVPTIQDARLVITARTSRQSYSTEVLDFIEQGGRCLVLADRVGEDGPVFPGFQVASREKTPWAGDWASTFSWLKRSGSFSGLPGGPMIDQSFDAVIPQYVMTGFKEWEFPRMVQAGIVVGWVHAPAALIGERRYGKGKVVLNTFHLPDEALGCDSTATALMDALIEWAGSR